MILNPASKRYAQALFDLSEEKFDLEVVHSDILNLAELIRESQEFRLFLMTPVIPSLKRQEVLNIIFETKFSKLTRQFMLFLESKRRLYLLDEIISAFGELYREVKGVLPVDISSSVFLTSAQINTICHHLKLKMRKDIEPQVHVDPAMLGGIKIKIGDIVHDYSFLHQLEKFKKNLMSV